MVAVMAALAVPKAGALKAAAAASEVLKAGAHKAAVAASVALGAIKVRAFAWRSALFGKSSHPQNVRVHGGAR